MNLNAPRCDFGGCARPAAFRLVSTREQPIAGRPERVTVQIRHVCRGACGGIDVSPRSDRAAGCDVTIEVLA